MKGIYYLNFVNACFIMLELPKIFYMIWSKIYVLMPQFQDENSEMHQYEDSDGDIILYYGTPLKSSSIWLAVHLVFCGALLLSVNNLYYASGLEGKFVTYSSQADYRVVYDAALVMHFLNMIVIGYNMTTFLNFTSFQAILINGSFATAMCYFFGRWVKGSSNIIIYTAILSTPSMMTFFIFVNYCIAHYTFQYFIIFAGLWELLNLICMKSPKPVREGAY